MQILGFIVWIKLALRLEKMLFMCVLFNLLNIFYEDLPCVDKKLLSCMILIVYL